MANRIDLTTVVDDLNDFASIATEIRIEINSIETNFIEAMQNIWSTELAASVVDNLLNAVNDYVGQLNQKIPEALENFIDAVNAMLQEQNQASLTIVPGFIPIETIARSWTVSATEFNLPSAPSEVSDLCSSGFSDNVLKIKEKLNDMERAAYAAQIRGLAGGYVNSVVKAIDDLIASAQEVADSYNSKAVETMVEADTLAQTEIAR